MRTEMRPYGGEMTAVRFSYCVNMTDFTVAGELYRRLEDAGIPMLCMSDSQSLFREMYVQATVAAMLTRTIMINPGPTNPITRHPAVAASAMATIDELSGGRAAITLSTGDSALYNIGLRPARLDTLEAYVQTLRALWHDHEATFQGKTVRLQWAKRQIPVYLVAEGPRSLRLAGRIADGVIVGLGLTPDVVAASLAYLRDGAAEAGRTLDDIDVWWQVRWNFAETGEQAVDELRMALAAAANHTFRFTLEGKQLPPELEAPVRRLQAAYAFAEHGDFDASHASLVDELGLRDYLAKRFAIAGTLGDFIERIEQLAALGATQIRLATSGRDREGLTNILIREVLPRFRA